MTFYVFLPLSGFLIGLIVSISSALASVTGLLMAFSFNWLNPGVNLSWEIKAVTLKARVSEFERSEMNGRTKRELTGDNRQDKLIWLEVYYRRERQDFKAK